MAIDGVAPRAKMNQQRSRRFKTAKELEEYEEVEAEERSKLASKGMKMQSKKQRFDHNVITPGTGKDRRPHCAAPAAPHLSAARGSP